MLGQRLREARKRAGLLQVDLAAALGDRYTHTDISRVESGQRGLRLDGLANAAKELRVSADYLLGLTDDPTPSASRRGTSHAVAETRGPYGTRHGVEGERLDVPIREVAPAAGVGAEIFGEEVVGYLPFRRDWLAANSIDPEQSDIVRVSGLSMEPTLHDGCSILVDRKRREPQEGRIYVMRTEEGVVVKRLRLDEADNWEVVSDNPAWPSVPLRYGAEIVGEVRWSAVTY